MIRLIIKKESLRRLKEDSLDDIVKPEITKRFIWPLYEDAKYEIVAIIKKYQNSRRYGDEILSFDFKDVDFRDWPALMLELNCSNEPYVLIFDELERAGLFMDEDVDEDDEDLE